MLENNTNDYDIKVDMFDVFWFRSFVNSNYSMLPPYEEGDFNMTMLSDKQPPLSSEP